jgi:hypothetical protein
MLTRKQKHKREGLLIKRKGRKTEIEMKRKGNEGSDARKGKRKQFTE